MDYGTDIKSGWTLNEDGDLVIISGAGNLAQAITNRLTCDLNSLDLFYQNFGCGLSQFLGWKKNDQTLEFIRLEIENRILNEPRIEGYSMTLDYTDNGVLVDMDLVVNENYVHHVEIELGGDGL